MKTWANIFSEIGHKCGFKIPHLLISFKHFLHSNDPSLEEKPITDEELKKALQTLKAKKSSGFDQMSSDVIKHIKPSAFEPMRFISNLSINFP